MSAKGIFKYTYAELQNTLAELSLIVHLKVITAKSTD